MARPIPPHDHEMLSDFAGALRWQPRRDHDRPSLDPTFQGMIKNAPGGPPSACGTPAAPDRSWAPSSRSRDHIVTYEPGDQTRHDNSARLRTQLPGAETFTRSK
jgi:hypothetical protein